MISDLVKIPNIGKTLAERLEASGIDTPENLIQLGAREAFTCKIHLS